MLARRGRDGEDVATDDVRWGLLMARAQDGDKAAYRELLLEVTPYLHAMARRALAANEVEDAVQDILLSLHVIRHTYDPARPFKPWLATIAQRRLVDHLRRSARRLAREKPLADEAALAPAEAATQDDRALAVRAVRDAVATLPMRQKEALLLLRFRELSLDDAARASGRSAGSLKVALHRALATLRRAMLRV
ncbi:sigma-70 family RNA polymerase sigma factor [Benzoatithermus flavus]|uniref:Sigma-70 family RNA polymerase sigma factor n=1 Tax=Benzoatithermus flavus TaxID=3108223 RepID=A0ABU8XSS1_9PROT